MQTVIERTLLFCIYGFLVTIPITTSDFILENIKPRTNFQSNEHVSRSRFKRSTYTTDALCN